MLTYLHPSPESVPATGITTAVALCPKLAALKARAKALKKGRKQEQLRFFSGLCASLHALGFSF